MRELFASVDLGGTKVAGAIAGSDGEILAEGRIATNSHEGPDGVLARIVGLVADLSDRLGEPPAALGLGVPGLVDVQTDLSIERSLLGDAAGLLGGIALAATKARETALVFQV
jgi:predicted NBD/HSP70 family sugar kinase